MNRGYLTIYKGETGGAYLISEEFPARSPKPLTFECRFCGEIFFSYADMQIHQASEHPRTRPTLLLFGRAEYRTDIEVVRECNIGDVAFENCSTIEVNGVEYTDSRSVAELILGKQSGLYSLVLNNGEFPIPVTLRFDLIEHGQVIRIEELFYENFSDETWSDSSLARFSSSLQQQGLSIRYAGGLGCYITGILAKDRTSALCSDRDLYREKFGESLQKISGYPSALSSAIAGLIYFALNQFEAADRVTNSGNSLELKSAISFMKTGVFRSLKHHLSDDAASGSLPIDDVSLRIIGFCNGGAEYRRENYKRLEKLLRSSKATDLDRVKAAFCLTKFAEESGLEVEERCRKLVKSNEHFASI